MTINEMVSVLTAFENGQEIEVQRKSSDGGAAWGRATLPSWDFYNNNYRVKPEIKERFLTVKELWGQTLINKNGDMFLVYSGKISNNTIWDGSNSHTVKQLHKMDWRVAGPDYDYNTANSLEIV